MKKVLKISILLTSLVVLGGGILNKEKYNQNNETLAIFLNEERTETIPSKEEYSFDKVICTVNGNVTEDVKVVWDEEDWAPILYNVKDHSTKCNLYFKENYEESILNGTYPILKDELIPITIDADGTVKKANLGKEWYSYEKKNWANAVILEDPYDSLNTQGKVHGATKEEGYVSFDGIDDYIDLGLANYNFNNTITLAIQFTLLNENPQEIFNNAEGAGISFFYYDSHLQFEIYSEELNSYQVLIGPKLIVGNTYFAVGTYDGSKMKLYINDELIGSKEITTSIKTSPMSILIGANPQPSGNHTFFSNIHVYEAEVYNRAISEEEIAALNNGEIINTEGLLKYVDFTNKTYQSEEIIPEEAIESYFVWIPKYRYQLWDLGEYDELTTIDTTKVQKIPIIFGDYNTSDSVEGECTTPMESGATGNCEVGDYMTHPAFLSIPSTGFWVGKFETGYKGATTTEEAQVNEIDSAKVIIKPNAYSWRGIQVANAFYTSYNYQKNLDSHMMKNTEWGAVAYLQHSKYGSALNLRANNNVNFVTGYGSTTDFTCFYTGLNEDCNRVESVLPGVNGNFSKSYATSDGVIASTTGNISGVYDMSGGAWEYVSSLMLSPNNEVLVGNKVGEETGFTGVLSSTGEVTTGLPLPDVKYYDVYLNSSKTMHDYNKRILGDATGEMGPFQESESLTTIKNDSSWYTAKSDFLGIFTHYGITFIRGGTFQKYVSIGKQTGIFGFTSGAGELNLDRSFRLVLTPV